jgi:hypothetical protein
VETVARLDHAAAPADGVGEVGEVPGVATGTTAQPDLDQAPDGS